MRNIGFEIGGKLDISFHQLYKKNNLTIFKHKHVKERVEGCLISRIDKQIRWDIMRLVREAYKDEERFHWLTNERDARWR